MKRFIAVTSMLALSAGMLMAQDGATLFKKCAACHGANGEGKVGPSIKGKDVTDVLTNGGKKGPHAGKICRTHRRSDQDGCRVRKGSEVVSLARLQGQSVLRLASFSADRVPAQHKAQRPWTAST